VRTLRKFLITGIGRKQYLLLFLLGLPLAGVVFCGSILTGLYLSSVGYISSDRVTVFPIIGLVLIATYFYVIKIKRLRDLDRTSDTILLADAIVPGGFYLLGLFLFGAKKAKDKHKTGKVNDKYFQAAWRKFTLFLAFFVLNYILLYVTGKNHDLDFWLKTLGQGVLSGSFWYGLLALIYEYFFYPYLLSYVFRLGYIKLTSHYLAQ
jgi:hypothetical protein